MADNMNVTVRDPLAPRRQMPPIVIGRAGEYGATTVTFDLRGLIDRYGAGVPTLLHKRPPDDEAYIVPPSAADTETHDRTEMPDPETLVWHVGQVATSYVGNGKIELQWHPEGAAKKSAQFDVVVLGTIGNPVSEIPDAQQIYLDVMQGIADDAEDAADRAEEATEHYPKIVNGNWYVWDVTNSEWVDTGVSAQGPVGPVGEKGDTGFSPEITSSAIPGGHRIDITNELGPDSFNVMDGEDGADGVSPTVQTEAITGGHRVTITDKAHPHGQSFDVMDGEVEGAVRFDETQTLTDAQKNTACGNIGAIGRLEYDAIQQSLSALDADISLKADEADIPTKVSDLTNDTGYITASQVPAAPVQSVNGRTGSVTVNEVPAVGGTDNKKVLTADNGTYSWEAVQSGETTKRISLYKNSQTGVYTCSMSATQLHEALPNVVLATEDYRVPVSAYSIDKDDSYVKAVFIDDRPENNAAIVWTLSAASASDLVAVTREECSIEGLPDYTLAVNNYVLTKTTNGPRWVENIPQSAASLRLLYDGVFAPSDPDLYLTSNLGIETAKDIRDALIYGTIGSAEFVDVSASTDHVVYDLYKTGVENGTASVVFAHEEADCIRTVTMTGNTKSVPTFGTIPLAGGTSANAVLYTAQSLTDAQKTQARTNVGAGTYSKPSGGIPASDLAPGVIPDVSGKANAADVYTKTEVDQKLVGAMDYKGTKATVSALPTSGNNTGDVWHIDADGSEWAWNGSAWEELGTAVDLSGYRTASAQDTIDAAQDVEISKKANTEDLADVATSGSYNDLTDKPTIPSLTGYATQDWVNNKGYLTLADLPVYNGGVT